MILNSLLSPKSSIIKRVSSDMHARAPPYMSGKIEKHFLFLFIFSLIRKKQLVDWNS